MEMETILTIVSAFLGVLSLVGGTLYLNAKGKLNQFKTAAKEGYDIVKASVDMFEDDKVEKHEIEKLKNEAAEFKAAVKLLFSKNS